MTRDQETAKGEVRERKLVARRWRTGALVAVGVALGSAFAAAPVSSHVGGTVSHLWGEHIRPKADARYYTKAQGEVRYYNVGETVAEAANAGQLDGIDSTGFLGVNGKAADSDRLDGLDSTQFLDVRAKAADSDRLDGLDSTGFLGVNGKAANSDKLDNIDSTEFVQGGGSTERSYLSDAFASVSQLTPVGLLSLSCFGGRATMRLSNQTGGPVSLWSERASTSEVNFQTVKSGDIPLIYLDRATVAADRITVQVSTATKSETFDAWIVANGTTCRFNLIRSGD